MSGAATIAITVGVAVAVLVGFFIVYYLGNVANSIYDVKVGVRKDFDKKVKELQDWIDGDTKKRIKWMREENKEEGKRFKESMEGHLEETFTEMQKELERLRADVTSLQKQLLDVQLGRGIKPSRMNEAPDMQSAEMSAPIRAPGDLDMARTVTPPHGEAPDMAVPKPKQSPLEKETGNGVETEPAIKTKPTPPPRPSPKPQPKPAGRSSVEQKAKKKKPTGEFESFNQFSEDFKAGS
ncbi:MAG: hypothetical protein HWE30_18360 [Methylocystaceae bacterium]|nr:hypothetical protein [Methylocystaceae bacterium]